MRHGVIKSFKTILVTTDFSETSKAAFTPAWVLAEKFEAKLVVLYVEEDKVPPLLLEYTAVSLDDILQEQADRAGKRLSEFAAEQLGEGHGVELRVVTGTPHLEVVRMAQECEADLIVMATHGRGFISHAIMGSTTERVIRHAPCPVLAVRATESD